MDLVILVPGDQTIFPAKPNVISNGASLLAPNSTDNPKSWWQNYDFLKGSACIELVSIHQGMKQQLTTDVSSSARTSGRPVITEFTCVKYIDPLSVKFYDYCLRAKTLGAGAANPTGLYICRNSGEKVISIMEFQLRDALISEIQVQTHPNDMPTEQFKLNFTEILWKFQIQQVDAAPGGTIPAGWSIMRNAPIGSFTS